MQTAINDSSTKILNDLPEKNKGKTALTIGLIGSGRIGKALATKFVKAGYHVLLSNRRGPGSLTDLIHQLGPLASEVPVEEAVKADITFVAVRWSNANEALRGISDWQGKIVVDTTNPILSDGTYVDLGQKTSSEVIASLLPGARVVKAFNSLFASWIEEEPVQPAGKRVVFVSGDDTEAKRMVKTLITALGFATVDLGGLIEGGRMQQAGKPLAALNLLLLNKNKI